MKAVTNTQLDDLKVRFTPSSLDVRTKIELDAGRRRVFDALLHIAAWWPDRGRLGARIVLEPRVGGRFFESCDDGCGILLGQVSRLLPPDEFAIEGSFGLDQPVCALWSVRLDSGGAQPTKTTVHGEFRAFGALEDDLREATVTAWERRYAALAQYVMA
jgi:uncharacterized protein YndB with AHSA1/START domain